MKKILSLVMTVALCSAAFGFAGGSGSPEDPWQISTEAQLLQVNNDTSASYILINDIDLTDEYTDAVISAGEGSYYGNFTGNYFSGNFNGNGFVIRNLVINATGSNNVGLFGLAQFGRIENLGIENFEVTSDGNQVGALIGRNLGQMINCYVTGSPNAVSGNEYVGGLAGMNTSDGYMNGCWANANVTGSHSRIGGLVGHNGSTISNSYSLGTVHASRASAWNQVGGLVGLNNDGTIINSYSESNVTGNGQRIGGLVGQIDGGQVSNSYAAGDVSHTGTDTGIINVGGFTGQANGEISGSFARGNVDGATGDRIGGFAGYAGGTLANCYATGSVSGANVIGGFAGISLAEMTNCYSAGKVTATGTHGGFLGQRHTGGPIYGFWDTDTSETTTGIGAGGPGGGEVVGKTTEEMMTQQTFTDAGWDFDEIWFMPIHTTEQFPGYPIFHWQVEFSIADFNKDGIVDLADFAIFAQGWLTEAY